MDNFSNLVIVVYSRYQIPIIMISYDFGDKKISCYKCNVAYVLGKDALPVLGRQLA